MAIIIRKEQEVDYKVTEQVIKQAFTGMEMSDQTEHHLVAKLRKTDAFIPQLSLVAVDEETNAIVGHILLSIVKIVGDSKEEIALALAPVSVLPAWQQQGVGKALIHRALDDAKTLGFTSVIVLGHPHYYTKFGFEKASKWAIMAPFEVPDEAFMAYPLVEGALENIAGVVQYSSAFME